MGSKEAQDAERPVIGAMENGRQGSHEDAIGVQEIAHEGLVQDQAEKEEGVGGEKALPWSVRQTVVPEIRQIVIPRQRLPQRR
jgi:hypothetical protein